MHKSKLLQILKTLSEEEIRRFHKFIRSPYYSYKKHCLPLFEFIRKYHPDYSSAKLSKENVFYHLFPDRKFHSQKMRHSMADLVKLLEDFLVVEQVRKDDFQRKKLLRDCYGERNLYEYFEQSIGDLGKLLISLPYRDRFFQLEFMRNQENHFFHPSTQKHLVQENYLETINDHLDRYFVLSKLHLATEMKARESILSKDYQISYIEEVLQYLNKHQNELLELRLYPKALQLYEKDSLEAFQDLKTIFSKDLNRISQTDKEFIFYHLLNFTIRRGNAGDQAFINESFLLYELGLSKKIIGYDKRMSDTTFTNICAVGIKVKEFRWVEHFIASYSDYLDKDLKENAKILCMAFLYYGQKDYEKTEQLISSFNFTTPFYHLRGKILALRALFELFVKDESYYDLLQSSALAFEKYLRRNKTLGRHHKRVYLAFIRNLKQLGSLHINRRLTKAKGTQLKIKVLEQKEVINKDWLIQKIEEIKR